MGMKNDLNPGLGIYFSEILVAESGKGGCISFSLPGKIQRKVIRQILSPAAESVTDGHGD